MFTDDYVTSAFSQDGADPTTLARQEIRQVCAPEFEEYARGPTNAITENTIGIIPTRRDYDELFRSRNGVLAAVINGEVPRDRGMLSLCIYTSRIHQVGKSGVGDISGAREEWMALRNNLEQRLKNIAAARSAGSDSVEPANAARGGIPPSGVSSSACASSPDATLERFSADFQRLTTVQMPNPGASAGARAQYQWSLSTGVAGLRMLEPLRICLGPHYAPNKSALEAMRDSGLDGCRKLSTDPSSCVAD